MKQTSEEQVNERIEQILRLNLKLVGSDSKAAGKISENVQQLDAIINGLNAVTDDYEKKSFYIDERTGRLNILVDMLLKYTMMDFSETLEISERGDEIDAVALGLNTMGEELNDHIRRLQQNEAAMQEKTGDLMRSNKQLEQFVYIASHDLQEPLRTLANYVNLFQDEYKDKLDERSAKYLAFINRATLRMETLIRDLLEYARLGQEREVVAVNGNILLREVLNDLTASIEESKAQIELNHLPVIYGHYSDLKSLFQNLVSNAIKFKSKQGTLLIQISAKADKDDWTFAVSDNGIGMEKEYHECIFSIFQKLHSKKEYPGTGIGLAHCQKIVELHHGKIWVESEPGKGSTFYFTIPKKPQANG